MNNNYCRNSVLYKDLEKHRFAKRNILTLDEKHLAVLTEGKMELCIGISTETVFTSSLGDRIRNHLYDISKQRSI